MDGLIYVANSGLKQAMDAQAVISHNLANVSTLGFRAERPVYGSVATPAPGLPTRVSAVQESPDWDERSGPLVQTGRTLDVAIDGSGWLVVQGPGGEEAFTRAGDLRVSPTGLLETRSGRLVLGNGGPISLPPFQELYIGGNGLISVVPLGQKASTLVEVDRLKLVNPPKETVTRGGDGLFRPVTATEVPADSTVRVISGALESSNVNVAATLVQMIELSRHFEAQVRALRNAEELDTATARIMQMNG